MKTALIAGATGATSKRLIEVLLGEFADFFWNVEHDNIADTTRIRIDGFHGVVDSGQQIVSYLEQYRAARLLP